LNAASAKPATDERLIFIDLNTPPQMDDGRSAWIEQAASRLERYEAGEMAAGVTGYLMITNMSFHRELNRPGATAICQFGIGIPDFNRPGYYRLAGTCRSRQRHIDADRVAEALAAYPQLPSTFDGRLPSEAFGRGRERITIGQTCCFEDIGEKGMVATVTSACIDDVNKRVVIGTDGGHFLTEPMTDEQLAEYKAYPETYFGKPLARRYILRLYSCILSDDKVGELIEEASQILRGAWAGVRALASQMARKGASVEDMYSSVRFISGPFDY
jgi:hypothetical protein